MKIVAIIALIVFCLWLLGSSNESHSNISDYVPSGRYDEYYEDVPDPTYEITSDNWECTGDCSGHEAGYAWAEENGISDPYDCDGNSNSFIEGCQAYANESNRDTEDYQNDTQYDNIQY